MTEWDLLDAMSGIDEKYIMEAAEEQTGKKEKKSGTVLFPGWALTAAAAMALSILLPNMGAGTARAAQELPVIGSYFKAVTFRQYSYEDTQHEAMVKVPEIRIDSMDIAKDLEKTAGESVRTANEQIRAQADMLVKEFRDHTSDPDHVGTLHIQYAVMTNTSHWYSVRVSYLMSEADAFQMDRYYTFNKLTGRLVQLQDLFRKDSGYEEIVSKEILRQMKENMEADEEASYFIGDDYGEDEFREISETQQFYVDEEGNLVIAFDEGQCASLSMGIQTFLIPAGVIEEVAQYVK